MNIDRPGADGPALRFDREVFGAAGFEIDLGVRGAFGVGFAGDAGLSSTGSGLLSDLIPGGDFGGVLTGGRFFFSGMPAEIIPSVGRRINSPDSAVFAVELHEPTANVEESKNRRFEGETKRDERNKPGWRHRAGRAPDTVVRRRRPPAGQQAVRESQIQAALDHALFVSAIL